MADTTVVIKVKCGRCGLHYAIYTCLPEVWETMNPMCPGCLTYGKATIWQEELPEPIEKYIPGSTPLRPATTKKKGGFLSSLRG